MANTAKQLALACEHLRAGNVDQARRLYRKVLKHEPENAEAWRLMGVAAAEANDLDNAAMFIAKAIQLAGPVPAWCTTLGRIFVRLGRHTEAAACFRQALAQDPFNAHVSFELGNSLVSLGNMAAALSAFEHAAELEPSNAAYRYGVGFACYRNGNSERAAECFERVLELDSDHAESHYNLGVIRMSQNRINEARRSFECALNLNPLHPDALNNLGLLLQDQGDNQGAASSFRKACRARRGYYAAEFNLARVLAAEHDVDGSLAAYQASVDRRPEHLDARLGLAAALVASGRTQEAVTHLEAALQCDPHSVAAKLNLALALLQLGRWRDGWPLYESRFRRSVAANRRFDRPRWEGEPLAGKRILLHAEQGFGDTIQFARFVPMVHDLGAKVLLECPPGLVDVVESLDGVDDIVPCGTALPDFDVHSALMSLAGVFETGPASVPSDVPYLLPEHRRVQEWSDTLRQSVDPGLLRVGLTWEGNPDHRQDCDRSLDPGLLEPLAKIEGVALFNLQRNPRLRPNFELLGMSALCNDFPDTAAAILNLDLVISVDTSIAHMAGALGKPVWTLLAFAADWRWMLDREDTPWYPTMRLFRQPKRGDWASPIATVAEELKKAAASRIHRSL